MVLSRGSSVVVWLNNSCPLCASSWFEVVGVMANRPFSTVGVPSRRGMAADHEVVREKADRCDGGARQAARGTTTGSLLLDAPDIINSTRSPQVAGRATRQV
jgi:hypothetical protein